MKVFLHTRSAGQFNWENDLREFARIPIVGEYVTRAPDSPWFLVELVVHAPYESDCDAEVFCVAVDHLAAKKAAFVDAPWES